MHISFWMILLAIVAFAGIDGWIMKVLNFSIYTRIYCEEGKQLDWGWEVITTIGTQLAILYALGVIIALYF